MSRVPELEKFKVALCQCSSAIGNEELDPRVPNMKKALENIRMASSRGAKLAVFGEVFLTGYGTNEFSSRYATTLDPPDKDIQTLIDASRKHKVYVIMGMTTRGRHVPGDLYNTSVLLGPEGFIGAYHKSHLASKCTGEGPEGLTSEKSYWAPGRALSVFPTSLGNIGIHICYEASVPEVARSQTLEGAHMLVNTAAAEVGHESFWDFFPQARAYENQIWYVVASVVGKQGSFSSFGGSRVVDPTGRVTSRARDMKEDLLIADVDYRKMYELRERSHYFSDRRPSLYRAITEENADL